MEFSVARTEDWTPGDGTSWTAEIKISAVGVRTGWTVEFSKAGTEVGGRWAWTVEFGTAEVSGTDVGTSCAIAVQQLLCPKLVEDGLWNLGWYELRIERLVLAQVGLWNLGWLFWGYNSWLAHGGCCSFWLYFKFRMTEIWCGTDVFTAIDPDWIMDDCTTGADPGRCWIVDDDVIVAVTTCAQTCGSKKIRTEVDIDHSTPANLIVIEFVS